MRCQTARRPDGTCRTATIVQPLTLWCVKQAYRLRWNRFRLRERTHAYFKLFLFYQFFAATGGLADRSS